jgi:hypothetical protein
MSNDDLQLFLDVRGCGQLKNKSGKIVVRQKQIKIANVPDMRNTKICRYQKARTTCTPGTSKSSDCIVSSNFEKRKNIKKYFKRDFLIT